MVPVLPDGNMNTSTTTRVVLCLWLLASCFVYISESSCNTAMIFGGGMLFGQFLRQCPEDKGKGKCPEHWFKIKGNDNCYKLTTNPMNWFRARQECHHLGGSLVIIKDAHKSKAIRHFLNEDITFGLHDKVIWTALNDVYEEGVYVWDPVCKGSHGPKFRDWAKHFPENKNNYDCVGLLPDYDFQWGDGDCFTPTAYGLCERRPDKEFECNTHKQ